MNTAAAEQLPTDPQEQLQSAYGRRAAVRATAIQAGQATARGRTSAEAAQAEYQKRLDEKQAFKQRHAERTRAWIEAGHEGSPPQLVLDPAAESRLITAEMTAESARTALAALGAAEAKANAQLTAAEATVAVIVDQIMGGDVEQLAGHILRLSAEIVTLDKKLRAARGDDLHVPVNRLPAPFSASDRVSRALENARLLRLEDEVHTPIPLLKGWKRDNEVEVAELIERRAALIAGEPIKE